MKPTELPNGLRWFTWGSRPPTYDESTAIWMPALIHDGYFLPMGHVNKDPDGFPLLQSSTGCSRGWGSIQFTSPWQWGEEIRRKQ